MLYKVTLKKSGIVNGIRLEKGASVEIISNSSYPIGSWEGKELIQKAFMQKYGLDLQKACALDGGSLDLQKIS